MKSMSRIFNIRYLLIPLILGLIIIQPKKINAVDAGLRQYEKGNYPEAIRIYDRILKDREDLTEAHFGKGAALYKSELIEEAMSEFEKAISVKDPIQKSAVYYNLGNALFKNGRIEESLAFYKKALELNPRDFDAKYNYELAREIMQNQQNQDKSQQNQDQQDKQDQSDQSKEQTQPDKSQDQQQQEQQSQAQEQQSQQSRREKEKSQEEAAQVLDALKNDEKKLMQERMRVKASGLTKEKDW